MPKALEIERDVAEDGTLPDSVWRQMKAYVKLFAGGRIQLRAGKPKRSTQANAYYWGVVIKRIKDGMAEAGIHATSEAIHHHFKNKYLDWRPVTVMDTQHLLPPTTTNLDSFEFYEYVENIRLDEEVLALGIDIPDPDPSYRSYRIAEVPT